MERRGDDLDEETRVMQSKECKECSETTKKDSKRTVKKGKQPTTKGTQSQVVNQRELRTRSGGENFIITAKELRMSLQAQYEEEDQSVWMTTTQAGFPTTATEGELDNDLDRHRGKLTVKCLHPVISDYILQGQQELSMQDQAPSMTESRALELENEWGTQEMLREDSDRDTDSDDDTTWEPNPLP
jgi:hypothetical protein